MCFFTSEGAEHHYQSVLSAADQSVVSRHLLEGFPDLILLLNREGVYLHVMTGRPDLLVEPPAKILGRKVAELLPPAQAGLILEAVHVTIQTGQARTIEYPLDLPGNSRLWFSAHISPIQLHDEIATMWVIRDFTRWKRAEIELAQSQRKMKLAFRGAQIGMWEWIIGTNEVIFNDEWYTMLGYRAGEFPASFEAWSSRVHPEDLPRAEGAIQRHLAGEGEIFTVEFRMRTKLGQWLWIRDTGTIIERNPDGSPFRLVGTHYDVDLLKQAEEDSRQARIAAESMARATSAFLASMSHEIRTPLHGMLGMADLLRRTDLSQEQRFYIDGMESSGKHLLSIVNDILDFSKIEAGKMTLHSELFSIERAVRESLRILQPLAEHKKLTLQAELSGELIDQPWYVGDQTRLSQVLMNLVGNAIKFTPQHGAIMVRVSMVIEHPNESKLLFSVEDTGIGIAPEQIDRLFLPFTQLTVPVENNSHTGSGLGLAISRRLVELMGGSLGVQSRLGEGSTFSFYLSFPKQQLSGPSTITHATEHDPDERRYEGRRVLIADDHGLSRLVIVKLLERFGCVITAVVNGEEAVNAVREHEFDLILLDVEMPMLNGYQAARQIRVVESQFQRRTPLVAVTAHVLPEHRLHSVEAGLDDTITKPVSAEQLRRVLHTYVEPSNGRA